MRGLVDSFPLKRKHQQGAMAKNKDHLYPNVGKTSEEIENGNGNNGDDDDAQVDLLVSADEIL